MYARTVDARGRWRGVHTLPWHRQGKAGRIPLELLPREQCLFHPASDATHVHVHVQTVFTTCRASSRTVDVIVVAEEAGHGGGLSVGERPSKIS